MGRNILILSFFMFIFTGCSLGYKMNRGAVSPPEFYEKISFEKAKGLMLLPCEYEGQTKNYLFDTGAQLTGIQRTKLKGKRVEVRGASNRSVENGTEVLKSFKIGDVEFKKTFATNGDMQGLKDQIPNFGGVLGRPIIDRANWLIDNVNNVVEISNRDLSDTTFMDIPLAPSSGAPYTTVIIDGEEHKAILDLGSIAQLNVPRGTDLAAKLIEKYDFNDQPRERYTVGGLRSIIQQVGILPELVINGMKFHNVEVAINESSQVRVGMNLFKDRIVYIDNDRKMYRVK